MRILLISYDNDSYISYFPLNLGYIASACRDAGHEVKIYNQDVYPWDETHLTRLLDTGDYDVVGLGIIAGYYQYRKMLKISDAINRSRKRPVYLLGGHGPAPEPEYFLRKTKADYAVIGEGEETVVELLRALSDKADVSSVNGIAYLLNNRLIQTSRRSLIKNLDGITFPAWDLFPMDHYALLKGPHVENRERGMFVLSGSGDVNSSVISAIGWTRG